MRLLKTDEALDFIGKKVYLDEKGENEAILQGVLFDADNGMILIAKTKSITTKTGNIYIKEKRLLTVEELMAFATINANKIQMKMDGSEEWIPVSNVWNVKSPSLYWFRTVKIKNGKFIYGEPFQPTVEIG